MKTLLFAIAAAFLTLNAVEDLPVQYTTNYCAEIEDGLLTVTHQGSKLNADVTLKNGTVVKPNGEVLRHNGTKFTLSAGECLDAEGNMINAGPDNKTKQPY